MSRDHGMLIYTDISATSHCETKSMHATFHSLYKVSPALSSNSTA